MGHFEPLARSDESDGVLAHDVAFANRLNRHVRLAGPLQDFAQCFRCPARRVLLLDMVRLDNFRFEFRTENFRGTTGKREQRVNSDAKV